MLIIIYDNFQKFEQKKKAGQTAQP